METPSLSRRKPEPDIRIILAERTVQRRVVVMPGNARYFRRRPWWMARCGASNNFSATVGFPLGAGCGGHTILGERFELVKAQRWAGDVDEVCVCDEHRVRTISCGNLPHSSGADAGIRHSVCDSRLAVCRDLEMVHLWSSAITFAMDHRNGYDPAFSCRIQHSSLEAQCISPGEPRET